MLKTKFHITFEVCYVKNIAVLPVTTSRPITTLSSVFGSGTAAQITTTTTTTTSTTTTSEPAAGKLRF